MMSDYEYEKENCWNAKLEIKYVEDIEDLVKKIVILKNSPITKNSVNDIIRLEEDMQKKISILESMLKESKHAYLPVPISAGADTSNYDLLELKNPDIPDESQTSFDGMTQEAIDELNLALPLSFVDPTRLMLFTSNNVAQAIEATEADLITEVDQDTLSADSAAGPLQLYCNNLNDGKILDSEDQYLLLNSAIQKLETVVKQDVSKLRHHHRVQAAFQAIHTRTKQLQHDS